MAQITNTQNLNNLPTKSSSTTTRAGFTRLPKPPSGAPTAVSGLADRALTNFVGLMNDWKNDAVQNVVGTRDFLDEALTQGGLDRYIGELEKNPGAKAVQAGRALMGLANWLGAGFGSDVNVSPARGLDNILHHPVTAYGIFETGRGLAGAASGLANAGDSLAGLYAREAMRDAVHGFVRAGLDSEEGFAGVKNVRPSFADPVVRRGGLEPADLVGDLEPDPAAAADAYYESGYQDYLRGDGEPESLDFITRHYEDAQKQAESARLRDAEKQAELDRLRELVQRLRDEMPQWPYNSAGNLPDPVHADFYEDPLLGHGLTDSGASNLHGYLREIYDAANEAIDNADMTHWTAADFQNAESGVVAMPSDLTPYDLGDHALVWDPELATKMGIGHLGHDFATDGPLMPDVSNGSNLGLEDLVQHVADQSYARWEGLGASDMFSPEGIIEALSIHPQWGRIVTEMYNKMDPQAFNSLMDIIQKRHWANTAIDGHLTQEPSRFIWDWGIGDTSGW